MGLDPDWVLVIKNLIQSGYPNLLHSSKEKFAIVELKCFQLSI